MFDKDTCTLIDSYAFVDGSYNANTKVYGYGGIYFYKYKTNETGIVSEGYVILKGSGSDPEMASMRNISGEIEGSMAGMKAALNLGIPKIVIYYDYMGIEKWATGAWKRNKQGTKAYHTFCKNVASELKVSFKKVRAHNGIPGNELADVIAKISVGILEENDELYQKRYKEFIQKMEDKRCQV